MLISRFLLVSFVNKIHMFMCLVCLAALTICLVKYFNLKISTKKSRVNANLTLMLKSPHQEKSTYFIIH